MKKTLLAALIAASFAPALAFAEAGDIVVRLRAAHVAPDEDSKLGSTTNANVGAVLPTGAELKVDAVSSLKCNA